MKAIVYHVVSQHQMHRLVAEVNRMMDEGWQPIGGVTPSAVHDWYLQSMVMYEYEKLKK